MHAAFFLSGHALHCVCVSPVIALDVQRLGNAVQLAPRATSPSKPFPGEIVDAVGAHRPVGSAPGAGEATPGDRIEAPSQGCGARLGVPRPTTSET